MSKIIAALGVLALGHVSAQEYKGAQLVRAQLMADRTAVTPGQPFRAGVLLEMAEGWHTYWQYAGDAGMPTSIAWELPPGFEAGPIEWPLPQRVVEPGDIEVFAYKGRVLLMAVITPPADLPVGSVRLGAQAGWLVCEEICIPGRASLELEMPVAETAAPAGESLFGEFLGRLPDRSPLPYSLDWSATANSTQLRIEGLPAGAKADFFPLPPPGAGIGHTQFDGRALSIPAPPPLRGVLVVDDAGGRRGWTVSTAEAPGPASVQSAGGPGLLEALLYGFLGGLILNLMPCVLPVISLKIFGFIRQAGDAPAKILRHGLAFCGGIFAWFLGLALVVIALKAAGSQVTWAFQFQNPWFNLGISAVVFVFALNLFGVFELVLPGRAATALDEAGAAEGYSGSFFQGAFATLLATPCTAPFLGAALGFAFSQSAPVILAMFVSVAAGMASPYLLLSAQPGWMKFLPKPGAWMERVKQFMGFPLLATLLWLLAILGNQKGLDAVVWACAFLLCLALAAWIYGAFCGPASPPRWRVAALCAALLCAAGGGWLFAGTLFAEAARTPSANAKAGGIPWTPFTQAALDELLAEGRGVFVDFTADWCISCKFNERTALDRPAVIAKLASTGIVPMKADWTNPNPEIAAALAKFGRVGVPFYVIYPPGRPGEPIILPELLTEAIVLEALAKAARQAPAALRD